MAYLLNFSLLWARVALTFYTAGMVAAAAAFFVRRTTLFPAAREAVMAGLIFHFVSLMEVGLAVHHFPATQYSEATSLLAFAIAGFFLLVYRVYSPRALSLLVLPLVFLLTLASIYGHQGAAHVGSLPTASSMRSGWIYLHVVLIFLAYAALAVAVASGILYLVAERSLKSKQALTSRHTSDTLHLLPPLETLDQISYRCLLTGFPLLTVGLVIGFWWAEAMWGKLALGDPKIVLALLTWVVYLVLLFARWSAGWRGRRVAYLTLVCFSVALAAWVTNGLTGVHAFLNQ